MQELPDALNPAGHSGTLNVPTRPLQPNLSTPAGQVIGAGGVLTPYVEFGALGSVGSALASAACVGVVFAETALAR